MAQLGLKRVWAINSKKCVKVVGNKTIYNSYAQHGMKGIKINEMLAEKLKVS
jgi:hypothetical protein